MGDSESLQVGEEERETRQAEEPNDSVEEEEEEEEELEEDEELEDEAEVEGEEEEESQVGELKRGELGSSELGTLAGPMVSDTDQPAAGSGETSAPGTKEEAESKDILGSGTTHAAEAQAKSPVSSSVCPTSISELSPTSVTQSITSTSSPTLTEKRMSPLKMGKTSTPKSDQQCSAKPKALTVKTSMPDGYNWRKYGQKQVKSPKGSRSYYRCTYSDCCAKKIECADDSGHVIQIVNKGTHSHDPPRKNNSIRESQIAFCVGPGTSTTVAESSIETPTADPPTSSREPIPTNPMSPERKRLDSSGSGKNGKFQIKEEHFGGPPQPKRRIKRGNLPSPEALPKTEKKPKLVVHAAGDVGISGDGYRWRKYGQKMVKGNPNPRNYYRCTSAGCPVRKHIETEVDNISALIITYKGVHDHGMPVPKKRHGPRSNPLVAAAAAPASMNTFQLKKTDSPEVTSTQGQEGETTRETLDVGGEKEKTIESARTLLSIGFEIKQC